MQTRAEHEAKWQEKYAKWNTPISGKPAHDQVKAWLDGDKNASEVIDTFTDVSHDNWMLVMKVQSMVEDSSYFPGNHRDFSKLPMGLACTMCSAFHGVARVDGERMIIKCEWPDGDQQVRMALDASKVGGAEELDGDCRYEFGITK